MSGALPRGVKRIASGRDLLGRPVVIVELEAPLVRPGALAGAPAVSTVTIVDSPRAMREWAALVLRQCDLTERGSAVPLRLVGGPSR